ncbi:GNAT family N-acetyltransferase [Falsiroseomonas tokyonensis]|uniref:GNAT family N-acetyltransferase n=1 Tax=Falsiroseomonas tokyonensis TaxID=430521 RepID=A0ABV7BQ24_9PROT|nr:GNAT family N-acetyltransferase [Falsiroseomonas tokyonensis]MBU8536737.1 GNAT family N-acetyltransferase [Falsiroseomonas tokyonensis]
MKIDLIRRPDLIELGEEWRALEARVESLSFFRSWSWVGCLAEERFDDALLLRAESRGQVVALALCNRRGGRLCLGESGDPARDAPFVEHNGPLMLEEPGLCAALLRAAAAAPDVRRLLLGGVPPAVLAAAPGVALRCQERQAPFVDLDAIRAAGGDHLASLSANARQQIRRTLRHFSGMGPLALHRAADEAEAQAMLGRMIALHEASWQARGKPGAFATPWLRRFHAALVARSFPRDEIDLLELRAGPATLGILYNFRLRGRVSAYQSGFAPFTDPQARPGLACHAMAIAESLSRGDGVYDFLGGDDRYKRSLAPHSAPLFWVELVPRWSPTGMALRAWQVLRPHAASFRSTRRGRS